MENMIVMIGDPIMYVQKSNKFPNFVTFY